MRPLFRLRNVSIELTQSSACIERILEVMNEPYDVVDKENAEEVHDIQGNIDVEDVSFQYQKDEKAVLQNVDLAVKKGETIALVGMSGGGESTLDSLISRFYDVTYGSIKVDGTDIRDVRQ